ncbi:MAG TPA: TVP38/TMEM64 family protein [Alphaproteobacteria bacterium]|nr:TVP38/TMEM64 family protein [Alphaproteobacteria bacterium]
MKAQAEAGRGRDGAPGWRRWLPLAALALGLGAFLALGGRHWLSFQALGAHHAALSDFVGQHRAAAVAGFVGVYFLATALSVPGATVLTLAGGLLFGTWLGGAAVVVGATAGAVAVFLAARTAFSGLLRDRAGPWLDRFAEGFREGALSYLLALRLAPVFPFFVVNLVPAFLDVRLRDFALSTFLGIIPGCFVYAGVGSGIGAVLARGETPDLGIVLDPAVLLPLAGLAALALLPALLRRRRRRA